MDMDLFLFIFLHVASAVECLQSAGPSFTQSAVVTRNKEMPLQKHRGLFLLHLPLLQSELWLKKKKEAISLSWDQLKCQLPSYHFKREDLKSRCHDSTSRQCHLDK